jgi:hypothetical protein
MECWANDIYILDKHDKENLAVFQRELLEIQEEKRQQDYPLAWEYFAHGKL